MERASSIVLKEESGSATLVSEAIVAYLWMEGLSVSPVNA